MENWEEPTITTISPALRQVWDPSRFTLDDYKVLLFWGHSNRLFCFPFIIERQNILVKQAKTMKTKEEMKIKSKFVKERKKKNRSVTKKWWRWCPKSASASLFKENHDYDDDQAGRTLSIQVKAHYDCYQVESSSVKEEEEEAEGRHEEEEEAWVRNNETESPAWQWLH